MGSGGVQGRGGMERNILNILKLFPERLKNKKKLKKTDSWRTGRENQHCTQKGNRHDEAQGVITLLPAFFVNELISGQSQMTHVNR